MPRTCHVFTRLFTSNTPWYFLDFTFSDNFKTVKWKISPLQVHIFQYEGHLFWELYIVKLKLKFSKKQIRYWSQYWITTYCSQVKINVIAKRPELSKLYHVYPLLVQLEPWINVQILKKAWNFAEMLNKTTLIILAIVPSEIWSDTRFILSWKMWY